MQKQRQPKNNNKNNLKSCTSTMTILLIFTIVLLGAVITTIKLNTWKSIEIIIPIFVLFLLKACFAKDEGSTCKKRKSWYRFSKIIIYALFTKLPIREKKFPYISSTVPTRYSLVHEKKSQETLREVKEDNVKGNKNSRRYATEQKFDYIYIIYSN